MVGAVCSGDRIRWPSASTEDLLIGGLLFGQIDGESDRLAAIVTARRIDVIGST